MKQDAIIQRVFIEINTNNKNLAYEIKDDINTFLSVDVFPKIEKLINALSEKLDHQTLQIPKLELNIDAEGKMLNSQLADQIYESFKEQLSEISKPIISSNTIETKEAESFTITSQDKEVKTIIYFLENGFMPWWYDDKKHESILDSPEFDSLIISTKFTKELIKILPKPNVKTRIVRQFMPRQIEKLCIEISKNENSNIKLNQETIQLISKLNDKNQEQIWKLILDVLSKKSTSVNEIKEYILKLINSKIILFDEKIIDVIKNVLTDVKIDEIIKISQNEIKQEDLHEKKKFAKKSVESDSTQQNEEAIEKNLQDQDYYINNAGLILIHPFIKTFFEECNLIHPKTNQLKDPELSAHLLHYITTGKTCAPEYNMIFEKFLCNIPIHQPIRKNVKISKKHKIQAQNIIESVQYHWKPMKNSSVELLRNEFFQRPGKLSFNENQNTITVERKMQDILLDQLSWGMSMVKIPWQEKFIMVNW